jgi:hypothetical protein
MLPSAAKDLPWQDGMNDAEKLRWGHDLPLEIVIPNIAIYRLMLKYREYYFL